MAGDDDDEKIGKVRRQARAKAKNVVACFASMALVVIVMALQQQQQDNNSQQVLGVGNKKIRVRGRNGISKLEPAILPEFEEIKRREEEQMHMMEDLDLPPDSIYRLEVKDMLGDPFSLSAYAGKVTLVVNTACLCGKTEVSFKQLTVLHDTFEDEGFEVLAFPSNDFHQELEDNEKIMNFVQQNFPEVTFPIFAETALNDNPVFQALQKQLPNDHVQHNFYKFLVDRRGMAVKMFPKAQDPLTMEDEIKALLRKPVI